LHTQSTEKMIYHCKTVTDLG